MKENNEKRDIFTCRIFVAAGDCNPMGQLQFPKIISHIIEIATWHANELGVGFQRLKEFGAGWILSRVGVEMREYPMASTWMNVETWVSSFSRLMTERCFRFTKEDGTLLGECRSIWMGLNYETRRPADLSPIADDLPIAREAPDIEPPLKLRTPADIEDWDKEDFRYRFTDLDVNGHVTTNSYVRSAMNVHTLADYRRHFISRFDMSFLHESQAETPLSLLSRIEGMTTDTILQDSAGEIHNLCKYRLSERK